MSPNSITAILSGALTGGGVTALSELTKSPNWRSAILPAVKNALLFGGLAGGSTYVGEKLLGEPGDNDLGGHTNRGALGGAIGGGLAGGAGGALLGAIPKAIEKETPVALRAFKALAKSGPKGALVGGALGALGTGAAAAYLGADEGMQLDYLNALSKDQKRRQRQAMLDQMRED